MNKFKIQLTIPFVILASMTFAQSKYKLNNSYPLKTNGTIYLDCEDAEVSIHAEPIDEVLLNIERNVTGDKEKSEFSFDVKTEKGDLFIREKRPSGYSLNWNTNRVVSYTVHITVPLDANLLIKGDDDNYEISNIGGNIELNAEDGNVVLKSCKSNSIAVQIEDGDLILEDVHTSLFARTEDGDISSRDGIYQRLELSTEDGDITMNGGHSKNVTIAASDGDIFLDEVVGDLAINSEDGNINIKKLESSRCSISTEDGDMNLTLVVSDYGNYELRSEDGDIHVSVKGNVKVIVDSEDSDVHADKGSFSYISKDKHRKILTNADQSTAELRIKAEDGDVSIHP